MRVYTVHLPPPSSRPDTAPVAIREGFSLWALLFTGLWALYHRMWLIGIALLAGLAALVAGLEAAGIPELPEAVVVLAAVAWVGASAHDWRRWHLARKGWKEAAVIAAPDRDAALRRYLDLAALDGGLPPREPAPAGAAHPA